MDAFDHIGSKIKEIYGYNTYYREVGYYITRLEHYERALKFFDQAVEKTPTDKRALRGRAWARSKTTKYQEALNDLKTALELYPNDLLILAHKSLYTFLACEFEDALIQNHRHMPIRKKPDHFYEGALQCTEAIENCVGKRTGHPLRDYFLMIRKIQFRRNYQDQHPEDLYMKRRKKKRKTDPLSVHSRSRNPSIEVPRRLSLFPGEKKDISKELVLGEETTIDGQMAADVEEEEESEAGSLRDTVYTVPSETHLVPPKIDYPYSPLQKRTTNIENYLASKYLEILSVDKAYLRNFHNLPGVRVPNEKGTQKILQLSKTSYKTVCFKQELLRTRRPMYYLKYQEVVSSGSLKRRQEEELRKIQRSNADEANAIILKLKAATKEKKFRTVLRLAEQLKDFCDSRQKHYLPDRDIYLPHIYRSVCQAHFDLLRFSKSQTIDQRDKRIKMLLRLEMSREPSEDSLAHYFKDIWIDYRKLINLYNERLKRAKNPEEAAWIYHELSRFNIETKQTELARVYCRKCIQEGYKTGNLKWVINALFNIIKINIMQSKPNDAKRETSEAIKVARILEDTNLQDFFSRVRDVLDNTDFATGFGQKALEKREKQILQMMDGSMREEAAHLFRKMSALPASRRMSVMPGVIFQETAEEKTKKSISINPSIIKTTASDYSEKKPKSKAKLGFSDMIEFHVET